MKTLRELSTMLNPSKLGHTLDFLGALLVSVGGTMLAIIPRIDLSLGGLCIALCGIILLDFNQNQKLGVCKFIHKMKLAPNQTLGILGLLTCVFLGGGEMVDIILRGQQNNIFEPGYIKVIANALPYAFAAILSFDVIKGQLNGIAVHRILLMQMSLFATGHMMISVYGYRAGNSAHEIGAVLFSGAALGILGLLISRIGQKS